MWKNRTIKKKITFWYTSIIAVALCIALCGAFLASEYYSSDTIKEELHDEVGDLEEDTRKYPDYFPDTDLMAYYDDGVMLSVYDADGNIINGVTPDDFPLDYPFDESDTIHELEHNDNYWYVYDRKIKSANSDICWIRGVHSYSSVAMMVETLIKWVLFLFPSLIFLTAFIGYKMISRSLKPVSEITETVNRITGSMDLSLRLPSSDSGDELANLTDTFNDMLEHLEEQFYHEKQFTSDAAHELRTPVSVILSHCEYALQDLDINEKECAEISAIYEKAQYMSNLVDALLAISRTEKKSYKLNKDTVNLSALAESVVEEMEEDAAKKHITINLTDYMSEPEFFGDMTLLVQLFSNLISNGIKYGNEGGYINVMMREEKGLVHIQFEDNGIGIPKESLDKIWNRFYQVDPSRETKGFGLGLFMVKRIVTLHKGSIEVSSTAGKGTVFSATLPKENQKGCHITERTELV